MAFWTGFFLGAAVGATVTAVIYLFAILRISASFKKDDRLHEYWQHSMAFQAKQIAAINALAEVIENK